MIGFFLGYSWLSNQYGLTIDNIVAYELVLPSGTITTVTETSNPDLWFGLRVSLSFTAQLRFADRKSDYVFCFLFLGRTE